MRRLVAICLGLAICFGGSAWGDKPKIAILGLEAAPGPNGAIDPGAQLVAREITRELRHRVQSPTSPYVVAPNSNKELVDEKLLMSCDAEAPDCMVVIGAGLASDVLLYGRVDKKGESFRVSLKLLDVKRRTVQPAVDDLPVGGAVAGISRRLYRKLIGDSPDSDGTLRVSARSDTGRVIRGGKVTVDEEPRGQLTGGKLTVTDLAEGQHTVAIEATGHRRFEEIVTVRGGERAALDAVLHETPAATPPSPPAEPPAPPGRASSLWKWSLGAGIAVVLGGGGLALYSYDQEVNRNNPHYEIALDSRNDPYTDSRAPSSSDCGRTSAEITSDTHTIFPGTNRAVFDRACTWHRRAYIGIGAAIGGGVVAITSLIMIIRDPGPSESPAARARGKKANVAIAPLLTPSVTGAQLSLAW